VPIYIPQTLEEIVRNGGNLVLEDASYFPQTIEALVRIAVGSGAHITLKGNYLPHTLIQLSRIGGNHLTIVVSRDR